MSNRSRPIGVLALLALIAAVAVLGASAELRRAQRAIGQPQLVSVQPLPETEGESCEWIPASAETSMFAPFQERVAAKADVSEADKAAASRRKPVRVINDPWDAFSAVAIDPVHNEVLMTDENKFRIVAYDRMKILLRKPTSASPSG